MTSTNARSNSNCCAPRSSAPAIASCRPNVMVSVVSCFERVTTVDPDLADEMGVRSLCPLQVLMDSFGRSFFDGGGVRGA